jgi:threonine/homoserine/homoserine lactone efflux protein
MSYILGLITDLFNLTADFVVILLAEPIGRRLRKSYTARRGQQITSGLMLIGLGTYVAVADQK